ncbi:MAG: carbamoyltransferase C-terminal domain-containing protein [Candidatus Bathyarchaeia archaeon]
MYVLGIHDSHNATACLVKDGRLVSCVSEERFTRKKNQGGLPAQSIKWCLAHEHIGPEDLDRVALASTHGPIANIAQPEREYSPGQNFLLKWANLEQLLPPSYGSALYRLFMSSFGAMHTQDRIKRVSALLGIPREKIISVDHHTAHAYSALFASTFRTGKTLILTLDAEGDGLCSAVHVADGTSVQRVASTSYASSLGWVYLAATQFLGMKPNEHEYKVMGLAPYAYPSDVEIVYDKMRSLIKVENGGTFSSPINTRYALGWMKKQLIGYRFDWIAGAVQKLAEQVMVKWVDGLANEYGIGRFAFGGGVFMNVKANMLLSQLPSVKEMFVMPSCGDESLPIGAAYYTYIQHCDGTPADISPLQSLYLGPDYECDEAGLRTLIDGKPVSLERHSEIEGVIADLLVKGEVVARFSGAMEWGARALGNRSILARGDDLEVVETINRMIKLRDFWMPFAPTILSEREEDYVVNPKKVAAPYMITAFPSTPLGHRELRAAMHSADKTLRPQVLHRDWNSRYYSLLKRVENATGLGGILNTSFNLHGDPIVCNPADAIYTLLNSGLRYLAIGDFLLRKNGSV